MKDALAIANKFPSKHMNWGSYKYSCHSPTCSFTKQHPHTVSSDLLTFSEKVFHDVGKQPSEVFYKKVFLKISQISQENTCVGVSF